ncbi:MAG: phage holin family protein [Solibacillus sp.]|uniref:phage holin family protein n=1 Tax=unclassified Solibacillus TaxID=2637870 RepID=UPI0030F69ED1
MDTNTPWAMIIGFFCAGLVYLLGGVDELIRSLTIFMTIDILLGVMVAFSNGEVDSHKTFKGLLKKTAMILMIIVAVQVDLVTNSGNFMRNSMILFLIGMEGISIVENLGKLGVPVPMFIVNAFSKLQEDNDEKKEEK